MAEVVTGSGRPELVRLGQVALPPRAVVDGVILEPGVVRVALERCMKEGGFAAGEVHLGIAGLRAITRELEMPLVPDSEIDSAVRLQALDVIPFAIDKALISARPLEETVSPNGMPERRVLVAAAHRDLVDPLVEISDRRRADSSQRRAHLLGNDPGSLRRPTTAIDGPEAIISIGADLTTVAVHENGVPHFVRTIAEGGDTVTAAISRRARLARSPTPRPSSGTWTACASYHAALGAAREASMSLIGELRSSIDYYATLTGRSPVRRVVVTGGGSRLLGLRRAAAATATPAGVHGSASSRLDCSRLRLPADEIARLDPSVAVIVGLAPPGSEGREGARPAPA